ncbi:COG4315 family predicted lipoprotein [Pseudarthrobacter sp. N5]|uniref:COG4315 family predicted lipoprotein n=1 Tax=Pseudarthrobacter sp. N5 TaxID=3418416 RepID=UPI003CF15588
MKKYLGIGFTVLALAATLTGCGSSPGTPSSSAPAASSPAASGPAASSPAPSAGPSTPAAAVELKTATSKAGNVVVDAKGMSIYSFTKDVKDSGKSSCAGACVAMWPAVTTTSGSPAVEGVTGKIGTITTADGAKQITLNGMPLYHFANDKAAGDILGQGVGGFWFLVSPVGEMVKQAAGGY